jgi:capsular polysaccharide export protein
VTGTTAPPSSPATEGPVRLLPVFGPPGPAGWTDVFAGLPVDAGTPIRSTALEAALAAAPPDAEGRARAEALLDLVLSERLVADHGGGWVRFEDGGSGGAGAQRRILVVDEGVDPTLPPVATARRAAAFARMMTALRAAHGPDRLVFVVTPALLRDGARSHLAAERSAAGALVRIDGGGAVFDGATAVHVVEHRLGLEAILKGLPVTCWGLPFWSGWGLDDNHAEGPEAEALRAARRAPPDRIAFAHALFIAASVYRDPFGGSPVTPEAAAARLARMRAHYRRGDKTWQLTGCSAQKTRVVRTFLEGWDNRLDTATTQDAVARAAGSGGGVIAWGMTGGAALGAAARQAGVPLLRLEDGFVRSVGLGTRQTIPASLAVDDRGIYYDAGRESGFEAIALGTAFDEGLLQRAARLRADLVASRVSKYNLGDSRLDLAAAAGGRRIILVAGQVPDDAAIRYGTGAIRGNLALLAAVRAARPDAHIVYKEHPDLVSRSRAGWLPDRLVLRHADRCLREGDAVAAIEAADEVHVLSSLAGFEALIRDRKVVTWGLPFYAGWGLTEDHEAFPRRTRRLALDELVAVTLILYPTYVDPITRLPCEIEDIVARMRQIRAGVVAAPPATRWRRLVRATVVAEAWLRHLAGHALRNR